MAVRLDDRTIRAAMASEGRRLELRDALVPGLVLRVTPPRGRRLTGKRTWSVLFRVDGRPARQTLGEWRADETRGKGFSVAEARSEAERILKAVTPRAVRRRRSRHRLRSRSSTRARGPSRSSAV